MLVTSTLSNERFRLAPFTEDSIGERYLGWLNDPEITRFLEIRYEPQTREMALAFVRSFAGSAEKYIWGIHAVTDGSLIGTATLHTINRHHGSAELGILIGEKAYWGGTTALDVLSLMIDFGFGPAGLRRLMAGTYARHWGMNLIYKKLGFTLEGTLRLAFPLGEQFVDGYRWGLLATEWKGRSRE